jgi:hypothetical protein
MPPTWWDLTAARSSSVRKAAPLHRNQERPASPTRKRTDLSIGLRPSEVCGLRWIDLDLEAGVVHVRQSLKHYDGKPVDGRMVQLTATAAGLGHESTRMASQVYRHVVAPSITAAVAPMDRMLRAV